MKELSTIITQTMSSREIAELTGKEVSNIHRDIKAQTLEGLWGEVLLDRYHPDILVSDYEVKYRAAIIKRWQELEAAHFPTIKPLTIAWQLK